ncbi:MAG: hypothetical protein ACREP1_04475 [Rhodanobacteraceae bacterium]
MARIDRGVGGDVCISGVLLKGTVDNSSPVRGIERKAQPFLWREREFRESRK